MHLYSWAEPTLYNEHTLHVPASSDAHAAATTLSSAMIWSHAITRAEMSARSTPGATVAYDWLLALPLPLPSEHGESHRLLVLQRLLPLLVPHDADDLARLLNRNCRFGSGMASDELEGGAVADGRGGYARVEGVFPCRQRGRMVR